MTERVLVIGAGIGGLCSALALASPERELILLERDPSPPAGDADEAFADWARRGVGHLRHSHAFLARLRLILRDEHPSLLADLLAAGARDLGFNEMLSEELKKGYRPQPEDRDFVVLTSRRTTLELVIRRYVERLANVEIRSEVFVTGLKIEPGAPLRVTGVTIENGDDILGDLVVDAAGRTTGSIDQLREAGAPITEESETAGILYFTRHYRLNPGMAEPPRTKAPGTGDLGFLKYGVFPADNGWFSITMCVPEIELEMRKAIVSPETFNGICAQIPGLVPWIDPARAQGVSRVFGMGDLHSRWRDMTPEGAATVLGYFPLGDSLVRTNPLYGRGCSFAAVSAYALRDSLTQSADPAARAVAYQGRITEGLKPYYLNMLDQDRLAIRLARNTLTPDYKPSFKARLTKSFLEDGVAIAVRSNVDLLRAALRGFHMLEHPSAWLKRPANILRVLAYWARGKKANAAAYPPKLGPERHEMMTTLGLSPQLDIERLASA
ncbi:FAD-dependent oxidoreductase [Phenylobacterium sp.]|uniref:NAD(P)/FAD-dependent oxidoreductase n=1 Tax=Phenylobacterium sp. TaxID=1871053 RepID=UPI0030F4A669